MVSTWWQYIETYVFDKGLNNSTIDSNLGITLFLSVASLWYVAESSADFLGPP